MSSSAIFARPIHSPRNGSLLSVFRVIDQIYQPVIESLGEILDIRQSEPEGHSRRVSAYAIVLAQALRLRPHEIREIGRAGLLHDIGKLDIPTRILQKPSAPTQDEFEIVRRHCEIGHHLISAIPMLRGVANLILSHHERFDGLGYPHGLRGNEIPIGARILALADTFDAMTSDRPYRKALSLQATGEEISRCSGSQFDPAIVRVFQTIPLPEWGILRTEIARRLHKVYAERFEPRY